MLLVQNPCQIRLSEKLEIFEVKRRQSDGNEELPKPFTSVQDIPEKPEETAPHETTAPETKIYHEETTPHETTAPVAEIYREETATYSFENRLVAQSGLKILNINEYEKIVEPIYKILELQYNNLKEIELSYELVKYFSDHIVFNLSRYSHELISDEETKSLPCSSQRDSTLICDVLVSLYSGLQYKRNLCIVNAKIIGSTYDNICKRSNKEAQEVKKKESSQTETSKKLSISEMKKRYKKGKTTKSGFQSSIKDPFAMVTKYQHIERKDTALCTNQEYSNNHGTLTESNFLDVPSRLEAIILCLLRSGLYGRCMHLVSKRLATFEEITSVHMPDLYNLLQDVEKKDMDPLELKLLSEQFDTIYINKETFEAALSAAGACLQLIDEVCQNLCQNGMALVRPPGHYARRDSFGGYCFFNNVAICAKYALKKYNLKRILIVDWDAYHGYGVQETFFQSKEVLYFSIHRYENATIWPYLVESNYDFIGIGEGKGYNFNVPLNETGVSDIDYLLIFREILVPVAHEFNPELVLVCGGYDAAEGSPMGQMNVTPACFGQMTHLLQTFANGKVVVCLEGGYDLDTLGACVSLTVSSLLDDPIPGISTISDPKPSVLQSITNCIACHVPYWSCFKNYSMGSQEASEPVSIPSVKKLAGKKLQENSLLKVLKRELKPENGIVNLLKPAPHKLAILYNELMLLHEPRNKDTALENPNRIKDTLELLRESGILDRSLLSEGYIASEDIIYGVHSQEYILKLKEVIRTQNDSVYTSIYTNDKTFDSALVAVGTGLKGLEFVMQQEAQSAVALIRPPGHHAEPSKAGGFCFLNNIALAARCALITFRLERVLIVDFDIHHSNGTYEIFKEDNRVLLISIHRYGNNFYPQTGNIQEIGQGPGTGYTVNVPWPTSGQGDAEYLSAFLKIVLPISQQFNPEIVLVSAGFDAAVGDPLGKCNVTPEMFGHMIHMLKNLAAGRIILFLEGGYNIHAVKTSILMCAKALLGDPLAPLSDSLVPNVEAQKVIKNVIEIQRKYWSILEHVKVYKGDIEKLKLDTSTSSNVPGKFEDDLAIQTKVAKKEILSPICLGYNLISDCSHLEKFIEDIPENGLDLNKSCSVCNSFDDNWQCLTCYKIFCWNSSINSHNEKHAYDWGHPLTISFDSLNIWCFSCKKFVDNEQLYEIKNAFHIAKFKRPIIEY